MPARLTLRTRLEDALRRGALDATEWLAAGRGEDAQPSPTQPQTMGASTAFEPTVWGAAEAAAEPADATISEIATAIQSAACEVEQLPPPPPAAGVPNVVAVSVSESEDDFVDAMSSPSDRSETEGVGFVDQAPWAEED